MSSGRRAFTLAETAISAVVLGMLAGAVLSTVSAATAGRQNIADRARAKLLADEMLGEIAVMAYAEPTAPGNALGPDAPEVQGGSRALLDDVDDYRNLVESPPVAPDGAVIPGCAAWTRETSVEWVARVDPTVSAGTDSTVKRVRVIVRQGSRVLARSDMLRTGAWTRASLGGRTVTATATETTMSPK